MEKTHKGHGFILSVIKGCFTALITTLVSVLIFAGIIKAASLNGGVIKAVDQFIKILSVFLGCFFCVKEGKGLIKGLIIGALSSILTTLVFSLVCGGMPKAVSLILDVVFLAVAGAICGIITVNVKKN